MQCSEGLFHWELESMIRCCLEYMIRVVLLQSQIGIHETNFQFWKNGMNSGNERQLRFFHYADGMKKLNVIQEQVRIPKQGSP